MHGTGAARLSWFCTDGPRLRRGYGQSMQDTNRRVEVAVIGPLSADQLVEFTLAGFDGDDIGWMLREVADTPGGRVVAGLSEGRIVAFLCLVPPSPGDRFYPVASALEVTAAEVAATYRGHGVFKRMFEAAVGRDLEEQILYAIGDPASRPPGESVRAFRERVVSVFGSAGFFPYPRDHADATVHRDSVLVVRVGRAVPGWDVESFFERLRRPDARVRVAVAVGDGMLRNLVRTDLERHGFDVVSVAATPDGIGSAEVVVTEFAEPAGSLLTVRLVHEGASRANGSTVWQPLADIEKIPDVVQREVARRRDTRWLRSSKSG